jgi:hypothetical protein
MEPDKLLVLNNIANGYFITITKNSKFLDPGTNLKVDPELEKSMVNDFNMVSFTEVSAELKRAESPKYIFYQYEEDISDKITWVEIKGEDILPQ